MTYICTDVVSFSTVQSNSASNFFCFRRKTTTIVCNPRHASLADAGFALRMHAALKAETKRVTKRVNAKTKRANAKAAVKASMLDGTYYANNDEVWGPQIV